MKIQRTDISRFLHYVRKTWKSTIEDDSQTIVFTVIDSGYSISMAKDGLLLTYLCNRVDLEASKQSIALPLGFLLGNATGNGVVELKHAIENGEAYFFAKWLEGQVQNVQRWLAPATPRYHLLPDVAWQTIDERQLIVEVCSQLTTLPSAKH